MHLPSRRSETGPGPPEIRYARSGDIHIAFQVVGDGPFDLLFVPGFVSHLEANWDDPNIAAMLGRLARFSRLILFDKRGTGLSDRGSLNFTLEQRMVCVLCGSASGSHPTYAAARELETDLVRLVGPVSRAIQPNHSAWCYRVR